MLEQAKKLLSGLADREVVAAVSGGMDSMCLLHFLHTWGKGNGFAVAAAHFNHRLRGAESDRDEAFVRDWCQSHAVPFVCGCGDVQRLAEEEKLSVEEAARKARYAFLREAAAGRPILTAHHADDNAETMLLNLLRGTGARGLAGIPEERDGILRPFLRISREELAAYAREHAVPFVEDSTNALDDAARNVLRHRVLPVLRELNPGVVENMARTAELLRWDDEALRAAAERMQECCSPTDTGLKIPVADCLQAERAVRSRCMLELLARVGGGRKDISFAHVEAVCGLLNGGMDDKEVSLPYGMIARREGDFLVINRRKDGLVSLELRVGETVNLGSWRITLAREPGGQELCLPPGVKLTVTVWNRDDRMTLPGSRGPRSLKRLCADAGIVPEQRDQMPVLRVDGRCAAVPEIGIDRDFSPNSKQETVFITFQKETEEN